MITCPQCDFANPDSNKFCQNCGNSLAEATDLAIDPALDSQIETENPVVPAIDQLIDTNIPTQDLDQIFDRDIDQIDQTKPIELGDPASEIETPEIKAPEIPAQEFRLIGFNYAGLTDVGLERDHNEDDFFIYGQQTTIQTPSQGIVKIDRGLFVVCDGMGGHASGEIASATAIAKITEQFEPFWQDGLPGEQKLQEIIQLANDSIYDLNEAEMRRDAGRMGTTAVVLAIHNTSVSIAHVGDSRIYQITRDKLEQITRDHEVATRLIDQGVEAEIANSRPDAHQLTQALGPNPSFQIKPSIDFFSLTESTLFLLCSDGLCDNDVVEQNWQTHLLPLLAADADLSAGVKALIDLGNRLNGHDNISVILVSCQVESATFT